MEIYKEFVFSAAHSLQHMGEGHRYARLHGHTFHCRVWVKGTADKDTGWIVDFAGMEAAIAPAREQLDHHNLNDIESLAALGPPTLENLARWLWRELTESLPGMDRIEVRRDGCNEGCLYRGP